MTSNPPPASPVTTPDPELFRLMAERVSDYAIFLLDPEGRVISWNTGARLIKQYEAPEIIGRHFSVFYAPEDNARGWPLYELQQALAKGHFEDEGWRMRKDGTRFWANVVITALHDNEGVLRGYSKITRDLTERKKQDEILRSSEERFRLLVEGVQDYAIYMLDPGGIIISWNGGAVRIKGYESREIVGQHFSRFYTPEDAARNKPAASLAMAREHGRFEDEGWRVRKDGSRFWARIVITALTDMNGTLQGFAKVTQDLTLRRHSEALEDASRNIHEFIAVLAHELRNPLAPIRNAVEVFSLTGDKDPLRNSVFRIIDRQSGQLMRIVDDLLDISRITRSTLAMHMQRTPVGDIVTRAVEASRPGIEAAGHVLDITLPQETLCIDADELRMAQVLTNILNNAARYTNPGGHIRLDVSTAQRDVGNQVRISVSDNGRGISPQLLGSIFGMFVQGHDRLDRAGVGLGVGLALARSIVEMHHGTLEARSEGLGMGSEFTISLPQASAPKGSA